MCRKLKLCTVNKDLIARFILRNNILKVLSLNSIQTSPAILTEVTTQIKKNILNLGRLNPIYIDDNNNLIFAAKL